MARPRPKPEAPPVSDDSNEYVKTMDFQTRSGGPRDFARLTAGSKMPSGKSQVKSPEPG